MTSERGGRSRACKWLIGAVLAVACIVPAGCEGDGSPFVMALQPFYTQPDLVVDSRLNGSWTDEDGDLTLWFEQGKQKGAEGEYNLVVMEKDDQQELSGAFQAHVIRLGTRYFLDIYPQQSAEGSGFYNMHFIRAHSIARLEIDRDSIQLAFLDSGWLKARMQEKNVDTPEVEVDGMPLLTGTTKEVQDLVNSNEDDDDAFPDPVLFERTKIDEEQK